MGDAFRGFSKIETNLTWNAINKSNKKNTWVSTHQLPVLPKKRTSKKKIRKKNRRNSPRWKIAHREWICFHPPGLSESHLCLPLKLEKCSPIFWCRETNERVPLGWLLNSQKKRDVVSFQLFNFSTFPIKNKISLCWSWIFQHPQAPSHVGNTATTVGLDVFVESPCFFGCCHIELWGGSFQPTPTQKRDQVLDFPDIFSPMEKVAAVKKISMAGFSWHSQAEQTIRFPWNGGRKMLTFLHEFWIEFQI